MATFKVITFDCDGVMFETEAANRAYYNAILAHMGRPPLSGDEFAYAQMQTVDNALAMLFPEKADYDAAQAYRRQNGYGPYIKYMEIEPDLVDLLVALRPHCRLAVATNRSDTMNRVLTTHGIDFYFDRVVTALDVKNPKPAADPLIAVCDHFGVDAGEMLYIGDSSVDETAARAAGACLAAYRNPDLDADYHIRQLREVKAILGL
ncbi:MAG: HAD family hydrolase [Thermodesulfobacteriota bacterium]